MVIVTFDTLKFVETLKEAGVSETQAKAFSTAVRESHEAAELATKGDIAELRQGTKQDIAEVVPGNERIGFGASTGYC